MQILIYGAGAIGQTLGCLLAKSGHTVDLILRDRFIPPIDENGLSVSGIYGNFHIASNQIGLYSSIEKIIGKSYDFSIITTKTYDTLKSVKDLNKLKNQSFHAVTMQNGCGNLEILTDIFGLKRSLAARIITGFEILNPGNIKITVSADATHIGGSKDGEIPTAAKRLAEIINTAGLPCIPTDSIRKDLFAKLLYNCALNPLGAILGVHYGVLAEDLSTREIMDSIISETYSVIKAMGKTTHWPDAESYQKFFYENQVPATYHHRPSMLQDIENNKPTEIDAFTGYVCKHGKDLGVPTPACDMITRLVKFKEKRD